jgi:hypothetical protein
MAIVKQYERPGRGCSCCPEVAPRRARRAGARYARRIARQALKTETPRRGAELRG